MEPGKEPIIRSITVRVGMTPTGRVLIGVYDDGNTALTNVYKPVLAQAGAGIVPPLYPYSPDPYSSIDTSVFMGDLVRPTDGMYDHYMQVSGTIQLAAADGLDPLGGTIPFGGR